MPKTKSKKLSGRTIGSIRDHIGYRRTVEGVNKSSVTFLRKKVNDPNLPEDVRHALEPYVRWLHMSAAESERHIKVENTMQKRIDESEMALERLLDKYERELDD